MDMSINERMLGEPAEGGWEKGKDSRGEYD
jgi:hypothetical protein